MNRFIPSLVLAAGLAAVCWVGAGYVGSNALALTITALIAGFYLMGAWELNRFQQATATLVAANASLAEPPASLGAWLDRLHPTLRNAVRMRIEGERVGLPGPAMTPYLAGLLVLLGMLGTFLGMVVTLNGTGMALQSATDLQAIRDSLSAPVKGLGLAFGTSVAGVAASAMLGLASAWCRRERVQAGQQLDTKIATSLRPHSLAHRRDESFRLLQLQAHGMPELVERLGALMAGIEQRSQSLDDRLVAGQQQFHGKAETLYAGLATSVEQSLEQALQKSLAENARIAGATIQPLVEATMAGLARETVALHETIAQTAQRQFDGLSSRFEATTLNVADTWRDALARHRTDMAAHDAQQLSAWTETLASMAGTLRDEWQQASAHAADQQRVLGEAMARSAGEMSQQNEAHAKRTVAEVAQLLQAASEAPRAAAEVVAELRQTLSDSLARDNAMLEERARILESLGGLLDTMNHASTEQRGAIDTLVAGSADLLDRIGARFSEKVDAQADRLTEIGSQLGAQVGSSAVEVASLGEAFGFAVERFGESNDKLMAHLQRIEGALGQSIARSDEQLGYYVAQAREVVDLSILSQKQIVEELQQLARRQATAGSEA